MVQPVGSDSLVKLPPPDTVGRITVEQALWHRRSVRSFADESLSVAQVGQLLWSAQGLNRGLVGRTAPSAGATYPMELYLVAGKVKGLKPGLYHYGFDGHFLSLVKGGDQRASLAEAALGQSSITAAPAVLVLGADFSRTARAYGQRAPRYVYMEAGHIGENVHLQCEALGLGTVMIGAFQDGRVKKLIGTGREPLYIMPVGRKRSR
ncbi:SagB/ThcOx family dehydrogenase [candidate division WOR-3 bacterium]|uniref:SagB/ThcOx family dehydrogenase n=1 Tax=candidate division WOR-3 bacterium TaxID=2052148 RepID=A0A937XFR4_UNCW3|nr:SagB/ThcOx family dehydrogenase [candidate division WOR-3 bacterium]